MFCGPKNRGSQSPARRALELVLASTLFACAHGQGASSGGASGDAPLAAEFLRAHDSTDVADYHAARDAHRAWLAENASDPAAREVRVRLGKLLFALGDHRGAAEEFHRAAEGTDKGDHLGRGALRNIIAALAPKNEVAPQKEPVFRPLRELGRPDRVTLALEIRAVTLTEETAAVGPERPIPEPEKMLTEACDRYFDLAEPDDPALLSIKLLSASIRFRYGHAEEGAERCAQLISRWPHETAAEACVRASIDMLNARGAWRDLERHVRAFRSNRSLMGSDHELERQLDVIVQGATFKRIQSATESEASMDLATRRRRLVDGAEAFRAFQREFPYSEYADEALYNAFVYLVEAGQKPDAKATLTVLSEEYASSPLVRDAKRALARLK